MSVPARLLDRAAQGGRLRQAALDKGRVSACLGNFCKAHEHVIQEKAQPDAFTPAFPADQIHAIVPVAGTDERQTAFAKGEPVQNGADTVLIQTGSLVRTFGQIVIRVLLGIDRTSRDKRDHLVEHAAIPGGKHILTGGQRQPEIIVRAMRAHAATRWRMPPMLHISFGELMGRTAQQVLADQVRRGVDQGHHVLQLITETKGASRLVGRASRPQPTGQDLIEQPPVDEHIDRWVRGLHLHRAERVLPVLPDQIEGAAGGGGAVKAMDQVPGVLKVLSQTELEDDLTLLSGGQGKSHLDRPAWVEAGAHLPRKAGARHRGRLLQATVSSQEFSAIAGDGARRLID